MHDCILLGACGPNQVLPQSPELPADIFTACLTTPIRVRFFCMRWLLCGRRLEVWEQAFLGGLISRCRSRGMLQLLMWLLSALLAE